MRSLNKHVRTIPVSLLAIKKSTGQQVELKAEQYPNATVKLFMIIVPNKELAETLDVIGYKFIKVIDKIGG